MGRNFSTQVYPLFHDLLWICGLFVPCVDVGVDVFNDFSHLWVGFDEFFDSVDGVHDSGVIPVVKFFANFFEG